MTNKQRAKVYRKAAEDLFNRPKFIDAGVEGSWVLYRGCCHPIKCAMPKRFRDFDYVREKMKEVYLFNDYESQMFWYPDSNESIEPRILCLLLCEQMSINP